MTTNIVKLTKPQNFPENFSASFFKKSVSLDSGVDTVDLTSKERDKPLKDILAKFHKDYGLGIHATKRENSAFEVMAATYIMPHNDSDFLTGDPRRDEELKEFQLLIPLTLPKDGYDVYVMDKQSKKVDKIKTEIGIPFIFDYDQIHWTLPSKLTKEEKDLLEGVVSKLKDFPSKDFENSTKFNRLLNQLNATIREAKTFSDSVRWDETTSVQFLASRVFADPDLKKLLTIDRLKNKPKETKKSSKKKFAP